MHYWDHTESVVRWLVIMMTTFETTLVAAAGKVVKAYHYPLQVSNVAVHMYLVLQLTQAKVLPLKFRG